MEVGSLAQALTDLEHLGGTLGPAATGPTGWSRRPQRAHGLAELAVELAGRRPAGRLYPGPTSAS